jgi:Zn ribbon nucleic-acid-binding protein
MKELERATLPCPVCSGDDVWWHDSTYLCYTKCETCGHHGQSIGSGPESYHPHLYQQRLAKEREAWNRSEGLS